MGEWGKPDRRPGSPKKGTSNAGEVLETMHRMSGITKQAMAEKIGVSRTAYQEYFKREMRFDTFLKVVDAMGYHMEIRPGATGLIEFRENSCENCEFKRFVEQTEGELIVDFYPDREAVEI